MLLGLLNAVTKDIDGGWYFFGDTMAVVSAVHPEVMGNHEETITVDLKEGPTLGQTRIDPKGVSVRVCDEFNRATFEELFLKTILD